MCLMHVLAHIRGLSSIVGWGRCALSRLIASISQCQRDSQEKMLSGITSMAPSDKYKNLRFYLGLQGKITPKRDTQFLHGHVDTEVRRDHTDQSILNVSPIFEVGVHSCKSFGCRCFCI